jgi:hypothetical protein
MWPRSVERTGAVAGGALAAIDEPVVTFAFPSGTDGARVAAKNLDGDRFAEQVVVIPIANGRNVLAFRARPDRVNQSPPFEEYSNTFDPLLDGVFVG